MHVDTSGSQAATRACRHLLRRYRNDATVFGVSEDKKNPLGPVGDYVRANVERLRGERGLTYRDLSALLGERGRRIPPLGLSRIEQGTRRVDADDLVALAMVLGVSPATLLLPRPQLSAYGEKAPDGDDVQLTNGEATSWQAAWRWATGEQPLVDNALPLVSDQVRDYVRENRPYERSPFVHEAARLFQAREGAGPWTAKIWCDGERPYSTFTYGQPAEGGNDAR